MKFLVRDLNDVTSIDYSFDFTNYIEDIVDIIKIEPAHISGTFQRVEDELIFTGFVEVNLVLACSKTLKPVDYSMAFDANLIFGNTEDADYPLTEVIELSDLIFGYIISEKPYTIYHPDAKDILFEEEKSAHPAFADLDKLLKK